MNKFYVEMFCRTNEDKSFIMCAFFNGNCLADAIDSARVFALSYGFYIGSFINIKEV